MILQTLAIMVLYFMIASERRKNKKDVTDVKHYFIKEMIKQNEQVEHDTSKRR